MKLTTPTTDADGNAYLPDSVYEVLLQAILNPAPAICARTALIQTLGEIGGIWPASVLDDAERVAADRPQDAA